MQILNKDHILHVCFVGEQVLRIGILVELISMFTDGFDEFTVTDEWLTLGVILNYLTLSKKCDITNQVPAGFIALL